MPLMLLLAACAPQVETLPRDQVFPPTVGQYLRVAGPFQDAETQVETATYRGPEGEVSLNVRFVGAENLNHALSELPATASEVGYDPALGQREGEFFTYGVEHHAAWGNGDWVFVLSATTPEARQSFLASYGF